jgi:Xaa-Pro aminopeptidase
MMGAVRFALVIAEGPVIVWEFPGAEHLARSALAVDAVRTAPGVTATSGPGYTGAVAGFAREIVELCNPHLGDSRLLAVERMDHPITDELRRVGFTLSSASEVFVASRLIKTSAEIAVMREAMRRGQEAVLAMVAQLEPGRTEIEVWSHFHQHLIANGGEYVSTRLVQSGHRTFPYFQEAGDRVTSNGDLFCIDTDAVGYGGYGVDFSRTFLCGDQKPTTVQRTLHGLALDQLRHNAALLRPGRTFTEFARDSWPVPRRLAEYGYYCLAHGLGLSGEHPYVPKQDPTGSTQLVGRFEPGMVICVESYVGDPDHREGVKLEDQYLVTDHGSERLSTLDFDSRFGG